MTGRAGASGASYLGPAVADGLPAGIAWAARRREERVIAQGGIITLLGMAVVFAFLGLLVGALRVLAAVSARADRTSEAPGADARVVAAIAAAWGASMQEEDTDE